MSRAAAADFTAGYDAGPTACPTTGQEGATSHRELHQAERPVAFWEGWSWPLRDDDANGLPHAETGT